MRNIRRERLRKRTFGHIEQELFFYNETKKEIALIRDEVLNGTHVNDNPGSSRSSQTSDKVGNAGARLADNKLLCNMQEVVEAIDKVYYSGGNDLRKFMDVFYFARPRTLTLDGVAEHVHMSRRTIYRIRHRVVQRLAYELGWW